MPLDRDEHDHKCVECGVEWICLKSAWIPSERCATEKTGLCDKCFAKVNVHPSGAPPDERQTPAPFEPYRVNLTVFSRGLV